MPRKPAIARRKPLDTALPSRPRARANAPASSKARLRDDFRNFARAAIFEAAEEVLAVEGLHTGRIEEIAQRARVAVGTIYNLVGDREALVNEILLARKLELVQLLAGTLKQHKQAEFRQQLHAFLFAVCEYLREHSRFFRLAMETQHGPICPKDGTSARISQQTLQEVRKLYRELIQRGVKQGVLRPDDAELYPAMLSGMVREVLISDLESHSRASPEERASQLVRMFLEGTGVS